MRVTRRLPPASYDEAFDFTVDYLRAGKKSRLPSGLGFQEGRPYDLYVYDVAYAYLTENTPEPPENPGGMTYVNHEYGENLAPLIEVAWALVSSGVVVPGNTRLEQRTQPDVYGFSLTDFGREWLASKELAMNPRRYGEFGKLLAEFDVVYGEFYAVRSQEALSCFRHGNFVACCAMAGACAETILFTAYARQLGDEDKALREMMSAGGRGRAETAVLGRLKEGQKMELQSSLALIKYWRDHAAHGLTGRTNQNEAFVALVTLLNLAQAARRYLL